MIVMEYANNYGISICEARRFTEAEKVHYADWYRDYGFVSVSDSVELDALRWDDDLIKEIRSRAPDGEFCGCSNSAWIISEDERAALIALNERKKSDAKEDEVQKEIDATEDIITRCGAQPKLYSPVEAAQKQKEYIDLYNEGGDGYVPHYYTIDEYEAAKRRLAALKEGRK